MRLNATTGEVGNVSVVMTGENLVMPWRHPGLSQWASAGQEHGIGTSASSASGFVYAAGVAAGRGARRGNGRRWRSQSAGGASAYGLRCGRSVCFDVQRCPASTVFMDRINPLYGKIPTMPRIIGGN